MDKIKQLYEPWLLTSLPCCPKLQMNTYKAKPGTLQRLLQGLPYLSSAGMNLHQLSCSSNSCGLAEILLSLPPPPIEALRALPAESNYTDALKNIYKPEVICHIEAASRDNRSCWLKYKPGLVTASFACKVLTKLQKLSLQQITGDDVKGILSDIINLNQGQTEAMKFGIEHETDGCSKYVQYMESKGHRRQLQKTGLFFCLKNFQ